MHPTTSPKLFLLDTMGLIYRAHFGMMKNPRITSKGLNTAAVYGFTNTLLGVIDRQKPTHIAAAMDCAAPTFRHAASVEYKSHREAQPEDITIAIPYVKRILDAFNIKVLQAEGYEADDVIGTMSMRALEQNFLVYLMSSDKDFAQLLKNDKIFIYKTGFLANQEVQCLSQKDILANWDIDKVEQVCDILGLQGDASDNIAGVPKIGPKTAAKLIKTFGSIENILKNTHSLKGTIRHTLEQNVQQALLSKQLATICTSVPLKYTCDELIYPSYDNDKLKELFEELEFRALLKKMFSVTIDFSSEKEQPTNLNSSTTIFDFDVNQMKSIQNVVHSYIELQSENQMKKFFDEAYAKKVVSFSLGQNSNSIEFSEILGFGFSFSPQNSCYISIENFHKNQYIKNHIKSFFESSELCKVSSEIKSCIHLLEKYDIKINDNFFDIHLAHNLIHTATPRGTTILAKNYLHYEMINNFDPSVNSAHICDFICEHADILLQLHKIFNLELKAQKMSNLFYKVETPISRILAQIEKNGVAINAEILKIASQEMEIEIETIGEQIQSIAGENFNVASPKQLGIVLFEKMKLVKNPLKTSSGQYVTNEETLQNLVTKHPIVEKILEYRELQKLKSTYVDTLPKLISPVDHILHTTYNQSVVVTGRLSSTNPNLQNIPIKTERGRRLRKAFVTRNPSDNILLAADYSQIELRMMASMSGDPTMIEAFEKNKDIHAATASKIFNVPINQVDNNMRRKAKTANFGIIYGISAFGLAKRLNISKSEAAEIIDSYFREFPSVKKYMDMTISKAKDIGYVSTLLGRRQYLRDINSRNAVLRGHAERNAINMPIQGTAAEMMKLAMINICEWMKSQNLKGKMIMQVHDELVFDIPITELDFFETNVAKLMINAMAIKVPIDVNVYTGKNWFDMVMSNSSSR